MADIFLSYAGKDRERVRPLVERLEEHGWSVWWDRRIPPGKTWPQMIQEGLDNTQAMVVVWSKASVESKWVTIETSMGEGRGALVPVRIDDVEPPLQFSLIQAADLRQWDASPTHPEFRAVIEELEKSLAVPGSGEEHADPIPTSTAIKKPASTDKRMPQFSETRRERASEARHKVKEANGEETSSIRREWIRDAFIGFVGLGALTLIGLVLTQGLPTENRLDLFTREPFVVIFSVVTSGLAGALAGAACRRNPLAIGVVVVSVFVCWGLGLWLDPRYEGTQGGILVGGLVGAFFAYVTRRLMGRLRYHR